MLKTVFPGLFLASSSHPLFTFGVLKLSATVRWLDEKGLIEPLHYLQRHIRGDWGDVDDVERQASRDALQSEGALASLYVVNPRLTLSILTNEDRSLTVIQLPEEKSIL